MILNEFNQQEIAPKLKDWLQKKKVNPSYNRNMKMMDEDKLLAYVNTAIYLGAVEYAPILKALRSEIQSRLNGTATKPAVSVNMLNRLVNLIDDRLLVLKIDWKQTAKDFEASKEYWALKTKYTKIFDNLFNQCSALNIQDKDWVKELSIDNPVLKCAFGCMNKDVLENVGLWDSAKNTPDLANVNKVLNNLYENVYKIRYFGLTLFLKFLDSAVRHGALNERDVKLFEGAAGTTEIFAGVQYIKNDQSSEHIVIRGNDGRGLSYIRTVKEFCLNLLDEVQIRWGGPIRNINLKLDNVKEFYDVILEYKDRVLGN